MRNEDLEKLTIEAFGIGRYFLDVKTRLDVEIVADVTVLEVQIDQADPTICRRFSCSQLHRHFNGQGTISDATRTWNKQNQDRPRPLADRAIRPCGWPDNDIENFLRGGICGNPIGSARTHQALIIAAGDFVAHQDKKDSSTISFCSTNKKVYIGRVVARCEEDHVHEFVAATCHLPRDSFEIFAF